LKFNPRTKNVPATSVVIHQICALREGIQPTPEPAS
jgi:hypothetical protein